VAIADLSVVAILLGAHLLLFFRRGRRVEADAAA
jgi:hypothetical protein